MQVKAGTLAGLTLLVAGIFLVVSHQWKVVPPDTVASDCGSAWEQTGHSSICDVALAQPAIFGYLFLGAGLMMMVYGGLCWAGGVKR